MNNIKLEFPFIQIILTHINERRCLFNLIKVSHKIKDAILSLPMNYVPLKFGDELRFPNIQTQQIFKTYDNLLMFKNRKIKYITYSLDRYNNLSYISNIQFGISLDKFNKRITINSDIINYTSYLLNLKLNIDISKFNYNINLLKAKKLFINLNCCENNTKINIKINSPNLKYLYIDASNHSFEKHRFNNNCSINFNGCNLKLVQVNNKYNSNINIMGIYFNYPYISNNVLYLSNSDKHENVYKSDYKISKMFYYV